LRRRALFSVPRSASRIVLASVALLVGCTSGAARRARGSAPAVAPADSLVRTEGTTGMQAMSGRTVTTLGIPPFAVAGDSAFAPLGFALADLLTTDLARASRVRLVERGRDRW
jgi:hypothetical protein